MVQEYQSPVRVYKYPFELVMVAYEKRFPRCPQIPVVLNCEITNDVWNKEKTKRDTTRRCCLAVEAPYLLKKMVGVDVIYFIQKNTCDYKARTLIIDATNESFASRVVVNETCRYFVHPENPNWTCFDQTASLSITNFFGFENAMEKLAIKQYVSNISKGKELIEHFITELKNEGFQLPPPVEKSISTDDVSGVTDSATFSNSEQSTSGNTDIVNNQHSPESRDLLDAEYIKRWLGNLTPMQESHLLQFKKSMSEIEEEPSSTTLLRFLRARDFNIASAKEMLQRSLIWRKENCIDQLRQHYRMPPVLATHFPGGWHNHDSDGRPLYLLRLGHMDVKGLVKSVGEEGLLKLTLHICEEGLSRMESASQKFGHPVNSWCLLVDLEGLNMRHLWRPGVRALLRIIETVEANYPDTMGRVLVVRAPRVFPILWTLVSTFIDENTRSKFLFFAAGDSLEGITTLIPSDNIPNFLGGPAKTLVHEGGLVPKSLYIVGNLASPGENNSLSLHELQALYNAVQLLPNQVHEVLITNSDPRSVLTWDFDVLGRNINFAVYRTHLNVQANNDGKVSVLENKNWKEDSEFYFAEKTITCRDGESIQGSHVMAHCQTYILQWRCDSQINCSSTNARVMYFHETLSSADYRGSMTSLQSGFSALSVASSCPSR